VNPTEGLPAQVVAKHAGMTVGDLCQADVYDAPETYDLGQGFKLYLVECMNGAYQSGYRAYIAKPAEANSEVTPVIILESSELNGGIAGTLEMVEPTFNVKTGILSTFAKGRGLGDCGESSETKISIDKKFGYSKVRTVKINAKWNCDGKYSSWPVIFKQK